MKRLYITILIILITTIMGTAVFAATGVATADDLNVRDGADTTANKIGTIDKDSKINIIEKEENWYKIHYNNEIGYVIENYIRMDDNTTGSNNEQSKEVKNENDEDSKLLENTNISIGEKQKLENQTTLYILPLINSLKLSTLEAETEITVISDNGNWLYIQTDKESGWITSDKHIAKAREQEKNDNKNDENNKQENNVTNEVASTTGEKNEVSNNITNETSNKNEISENTSEEYPKTMYLSVNSANIRKTPSSTGEVISGTAKGDQLKVIGKEGEWYKISNEDGTGYIRSDLVSENKN